MRGAYALLNAKTALFTLREGTVVDRDLVLTGMDDIETPGLFSGFANGNGNVRP